MREAVAWEIGDQDTTAIGKALAPPEISASTKR